MQNRYAGDVGDFGKFALLRALFGSDKYQLGIVWYLYPDETHNDDGRHIGYLKNPVYRRCCSSLCDQLARVVTQRRSVHALEQAELLPNTTKYFSEILDFHLKYPTQTRDDKSQREELRADWIERAVTFVADCNAVFLDPDNGLQVISCPSKGRIKAGKFAYYDEIEKLLKGKNACVIYHHLNRHKDHGTHENQIQTRSRELLEKIKPEGKIFALRFTPYSPRAYFILTTKKSALAIKSAIQNFMASPCGIHWDLYLELSSNQI